MQIVHWIALHPPLMAWLESAIAVFEEEEEDLGAAPN
jgi:hypothetical protein